MNLKKCLNFALSLVLVATCVHQLDVNADEKPYIPIVSKGDQNDFWQQVKLGANKAAEKYSVLTTFEGPPAESDVSLQVEMLNNAMAKQPVAIVLAAIDATSVIDQLELCRDEKIPVIGFDSGIPDAPQGSVYATASTNNYKAAGLAAEKMFAALKDKIKAATSEKPVTITVISSDAAGESLLSRGKGFRDRMIELITTNTDHKKSDIKVKGSPAYIAADSPVDGDKIFIDMVVPATSAATDVTSSAYIVLNKVEDDNVIGLFCSNETSVKGLLSASNDGEDLGYQYKDLLVIGFDAGTGQKNAVREGYFYGSITQDPYMIGYRAIELAYKAFKGEKVSDIDTGAKFYNKENMDNDDIKGLLYN